MIALIWMRDAGKRASDDRVARVNPQYKKSFPNLEVLDNSALTLKSHDAGSVTCSPRTQTGKMSESKSQKWTVLMEIVKDNLCDMHCLKGKTMK